jgi:N-acetylglucosaminyl-diphospho-decaprenol L-rhamnosyltransferase
VITVSIVSHGHGRMVEALLRDIGNCPEVTRVVLTINVPEQEPAVPASLAGLVIVQHNAAPKGFGANHNAAFQLAAGEWFCVLNPDIRMPENPFPILLEEIERQQAAVIAPAVFSPTAKIEDSIRRFPTPISLAGKMLGGGGGRYSFEVGDETFDADWVAGMFMLFRADDYRALGGFDEGFFLYYEDVDICARLWKAGRPVLACPKAQVIHDARRASRQNLRYMRWHAGSMARYLGKHWLRLPNKAHFE